MVLVESADRDCREVVSALWRNLVSTYLICYVCALGLDSGIK